MSVLSFRVSIHERSAHWVQVQVYQTHGAYTRATGFLRKQNRNKKGSKALASCWQWFKPSEDGCIAHILFSRQNLTLEYIVHEAMHAAFHRAKLIGVKGTDFEEFIAQDTGVVAEGIIAFLDWKKVPVRYCFAKRKRLANFH